MEYSEEYSVPHSNKCINHLNTKSGTLDTENMKMPFDC